MSSFLDRLKKKNVIPATPDDDKREKLAVQAATNPTPQDVALGAEQLKVDIFKAPGVIMVYAQIAGLKIEGLDVMIEGDNDVVTIKGERMRPSGEQFPNFNVSGKEKVLEECSWGPFYRQIILPAEVDPERTVA